MLSFPIILLLIVVGFFSGSVAGLLGLGGGIMMNPLCLIIYQHFVGIENAILFHTVAGTNLFVVSFYSLFGTFRYYIRNLVMWQGVFGIGLFSILGAFAGSTVATTYLSSGSMFRLFGIIVLLGGIKMFYEVYPAEDRKPKINIFALAITGIVTAFVAGMVGVGGGLMTLPIMLFLFHFPVEKLPGTSSGIIFFVALSGMISYIINGWSDPRLPEYSLGFVYLPAGIPLIVGAFMGITFGTWLNERVSTKRIKQIFGLLLIAAFFKITIFAN